MIPLLAAEVVQRHGWLTASQFADLLALSQLTPGPIMVNAATFIGYRVGGISGAVLATVGVVLPAFLIILVLIYYYRRFRQNLLARRVSRGFYPVAVALLAGATLFFSETITFSWKTIGIASLSWAGLATRRLDPFWVLLTAAFLGRLL